MYAKTLATPPKARISPGSGVIGSCTLWSPAPARTSFSDQSCSNQLSPRFRHPDPRGYSDFHFSVVCKHFAILLDRRSSRPPSPSARGSVTRCRGKATRKEKVTVSAVGLTIAKIPITSLPQVQRPEIEVDDRYGWKFNGI